MTGRELIIYILENGYEHEQILENGNILGFMTIQETACKFNVGIDTVKTWVKLNIVPNFTIGNEIYIPANIDTSKQPVYVI